MSRRFQLEVRESQGALETLLRQYPQEPYRPRFQMLYWVAKQAGEFCAADSGSAGGPGNDCHPLGTPLAQRRDRALAPASKPSRDRSVLEARSLGAVTAMLEQPEGFESYFEIQAWLREQFGIELCYSRLHQIVYRQLNARPKADQREQAQAELKKQTLTGKRIPRHGVKPTAIVQWPRQSTWLYGAVEIQTSKSLFWEYSHLNNDCFKHFIEQLSLTFPRGLNVVQLDRAA